MTQEPEHGAGPVTSTTLLEGLRDPTNRTVWRDYVGRYRPLVVRYATRLGAPGEDAEDIAQGALLAFSTAYRDGRYDRARGRLSSWLFGIVTNELRSWRRRAAQQHEVDATLVDPAAEAELVEIWEHEWRDSVLSECLEIVRQEVRPATMRAFELFALDERPATEVASALGITENAVFGAKRRVLQRVRDLMPLIEDVW